MTENIVTGKKYRILTDAANDIWDRISFWSKASDVQYDDNTTAEANKAVAILKRNASYTVGAVAYEPSAPSWVLLKCTQAGTTAAVIPSTYSTISSVGTVITDGTARFTVYDVRPSATLSASAFQVPAMSLVNGLNSELTANGNKFYFDYQNDKYGYNTSASRAAASFVPFGGTDLPNTLGFTAYAGSTPLISLPRDLLKAYMQFSVSSQLRLYHTNQAAVDIPANTLFYVDSYLNNDDTELSFQYVYGGTASFIVTLIGVR